MLKQEERFKLEAKTFVGGQATANVLGVSDFTDGKCKENVCSGKRMWGDGDSKSKARAKYSVESQSREGFQAGRQLKGLCPVWRRGKAGLLAQEALSPIQGEIWHT